jgi:hypothetical protein
MNPTFLASLSAFCRPAATHTDADTATNGFLPPKVFKIGREKENE